MTGRPAFSLVQLEYFVAAAEAGTMSLAAERLHTTQSALSSAIIRLERQLGCQLFVRHHARGISLTSAGRPLLASARAVLRQVDDLVGDSRTLQDEISGTLDVGCFVTLVPFLIPPALRRLREQHPELTVRVQEADTHQLFDSLREGLSELVLSYDIGLGDDLEFEPLAELRPYALVAADDPLAGAESATLADLARRPLVLLDLVEPGLFVRNLLSEVLPSIPSIVPTTSFEGMRALVAAGMGFTILNQRVATPITYDGGEVHPLEIEDDIPSIRIGVVTARASRPTRRAQTLVETLRQLRPGPPSGP
ncbi:LysR family transcriptional regulator [Amycolatopsis cihanbeyliensis]|uniref:LysR family transcriptional regulator n=1 Tax=Amycolatopsis cihanbeyliensis TaxID=1128664 RepID=A0A542DRE6_AMYCI|nr:LysR family transcriptional regulator [Amycolatopsis cihanbeyliensis]TQJ05586.1 LysR family transcriptional regulator [Amycolatopsis cihanbeyliensis]